MVISKGVLQLNEKSYELLKKYTPFALCALQSEDYFSTKEKYRMGILLLSRGKLSDAAVLNARKLFRGYMFSNRGFMSSNLIGLNLEQCMDKSCPSLSVSDLRLLVADVSSSTAKSLISRGCCGVIDSNFVDKCIHGTQADLVNLLWDFCYLYTVDLVPCCTSEVSSARPRLFWDRFYNDFSLYALDGNGGATFICKAMKPKSTKGMLFESKTLGEYTLSTTKRIAILRPNKQRHDMRDLGFNFMLDFNYGSCGIVETYIARSRFVTKTSIWVANTMSWSLISRNIEEICGYKLV